MNVFSEIIAHQAPVKRDSRSTLNSSEALRIVRQGKDSNFSLSQEINSSKNNVKFDGSKAIQVGDVIYNFYAISSDSEILTKFHSRFNV